VPRRPPLRRVLLVAGLAATVVTLTACTAGPSRPKPAASGPVAVPVPTASAALVVSSCRALISSLPDELDSGVRRRPVTGDATRTAAWGDPAITLRCGVAHATTGVGPITIDGLSFLTNASAGITTWTTTDRAVNVSIDVPKSYAEQVYDVNPLVGALLRALPAASAAPGP
jgi:hypothetical protein